jgi:hypothetical protein
MSTWRDRVLQLGRQQHLLLPVIWLVLTCLVLVPVWHQRLLPLLDAPNHLALVRAWHSFSDPRYHIADFYQLRIRPVPYFLYYFSVHLLMYAFPIEVANKVFLSAYLILFPLSVLSLTRALKRSAWLALAAFPLAFNQNWVYGFTSYLMGTAFLFFALAALVRYLDEGRPRTLAWLCVSTLLAFFSHILPWFCFGLGAIAILLLDRKNLRRAVSASLAMLPSLLLAISSVLEEKADGSYLNRGERTAGMWFDFPTLVKQFPNRVLEIIPGNLDAWVLLGVVVTGVAVYLTRERVPIDQNDRRLRWLLGIFGLAYISLPYQVTHPFYWWYIAPRLPSVIAPLAMLLPTGAVRGWRRLLFVPLVAGAIALPLTLARLYREFSNRNAAFMQLVAEIPYGKTVFVAPRGLLKKSMDASSPEASGDKASSGPVYNHWGSWPMILRGGYNPYLFDQGIPVRPKVHLKAPAGLQPDRFEVRDAPEFDYYLVRSPTETMSREPSLKQTEQLGEWVLFQRVGNLSDEP